MTLFLAQFSIEDLRAQPKQTACWDGVRNYQVSRLDRTSRPGGGDKSLLPSDLFSSKISWPRLFFPRTQT